MFLLNNRKFQLPEITFAVNKNYFDQNMKSSENLYKLEDSVYVRSVNEDDLTLKFSAQNDCKYSRSFNPYLGILGKNKNVGWSSSGFCREKIQSAALHH